MKIRRAPLAQGQGVGFNGRKAGGAIMTPHELVEINRDQFRLMHLFGLELIPVYFPCLLGLWITAPLAGLRVSHELEKQYGCGLTLGTVKIWLRRLLFVYLFPIGLIDLVCFQLFTSDYYETLLRFVPTSVLDHWLFMFIGTPAGVVITNATAYLIILHWVRVRKFKPEPLPQKPSKQAIDMSKWELNENGQYYRVTYRKGKDVLYDTASTYEQRAIDWIQTKRWHRRYGWGVVLSALICIGIIRLAESTPNSADRGGLTMLFGFVCFFGVLFLINWLGGLLILSRGRGNFVGPAPIAPPTLDEALSHNTRNDARQPDIDAIERALRAREGRGGDGEPQYKFKA